MTLPPRRRLLVPPVVAVWGTKAIALAALAVLPALAAPPQVNLMVEMRAVVLAESPAAEAHGAFVVGTRGGSPTGAGDARLSTRRDAGSDVQQVLVLNGGAASLRASRLLPLSTGEWLWGSSAGGATGGGVGQTLQWIEAGRGFQVKPSWPGGKAPVTLEISAEARQRTTVQTRLLLQPGVWTDFARSARTALQVRVSPAP